jgi:prepilin-type N-terminal cleavage/methylation domain-containing protein
VNRQRGFTLMELVITMAIFGMFLMMLGALTMEMRGQEKRYPVNFMQHPQVVAVLSRMRRDVEDAFGSQPYLQSSPDGRYQMSSQVLIFQTMVAGGTQTVVWDLSKSREVHRISYNVGVPTEWVARGLPAEFAATFDDVTVPGHPDGVRITAADSHHRLTIDQYLQPRAHD